MDHTPTDDELAFLAEQVDEQLKMLRSLPGGPPQSRAIVRGARELPFAPEQQALIERVTKEPFDTFWEKYRRHLRRDLCLPGGLLYEQWQKWRDLESGSAVRVSYAWLAAIGISGESLGPVAVAATVFLLNVLLNVGIEAVCEGCAPNGAADRAISPSSHRKGKGGAS